MKVDTSHEGGGDRRFGSDIVVKGKQSQNRARYPSLCAQSVKFYPASLSPRKLREVDSKMYIETGCPQSVSHHPPIPNARSYTQRSVV